MMETAAECQKIIDEQLAEIAKAQGIIDEAENRIKLAIDELRKINYL